eukprot:449490_1
MRARDNGVDAVKKRNKYNMNVNRRHKIKPRHIKRIRYDKNGIIEEILNEEDIYINNEDNNMKERVLNHYERHRTRNNMVNKGIERVKSNKYNEKRKLKNKVKKRSDHIHIAR